MSDDNYTAEIAYRRSVTGAKAMARRVEDIAGPSDTEGRLPGTQKDLCNNLRPLVRFLADVNTKNAERNERLDMLETRIKTLEDFRQIEIDGLAKRLADVETKQLAPTYEGTYTA